MESTGPAIRGLGSLLLAVDHVGVAVPELDPAIEFYTQTLGFRLVHREDNPEQQISEAMLESPEPGASLQLLAPSSDTSPIAKFLERGSGGMQQLALRVSDVERAADQLRAAGLVLLYETSRTGTGGTRINFVHPKSTGGVLIELVEY